MILPHGAGLLIAAEAKTGRDGIDVQQQDALVTPSDLPDSLLRYLIRTQQSVILDDATVQNLFSEDEYVRRQGPRSILCLPLMKQAKLMGVLYLENKLAPRVFTPKRLTMLDLMASQAAISLEHARLYAGLGRLNAELTKENSDRRKAEEALRTSEERLQNIVERSNIPGRLRCNFHSTGVPEENLPPSVQQDLLRIAQEAMSNAVRHAKPTVISVNLRCHPPDLVLEVTDNGSGIADSQAASREGFGFSNMRARAENIGAQLEVRSEAGRGTTIVVHVPMNF